MNSPSRTMTTKSYRAEEIPDLLARLHGLNKDASGPDYGEVDGKRMVFVAVHPGSGEYEGDTTYFEPTVKYCGGEITWAVFLAAQDQIPKGHQDIVAFDVPMWDGGIEGFFIAADDLVEVLVPEEFVFDTDGSEIPLN